MPLTGEDKAKWRREYKARKKAERQAAKLAGGVKTARGTRATVPQVPPGGPQGPPEQLAGGTKEEQLPPLTPREERLVGLVIAGGKSLAQCCREAGFGNGDNPGGSIYARLRNGDLRQHIRSQFARLGLLPEVAALKVLEKFDAKETKFFKFGGNETLPEPIIESREVEAHGIQLDAAVTTLKAFGALEKQDEPAAAVQGPVSINVQVVAGNVATPADGIILGGAVRVRVAQGQGGDPRELVGTVVRGGADPSTPPAAGGNGNGHGKRRGW